MTRAPTCGSLIRATSASVSLWVLVVCKRRVSTRPWCSAATRLSARTSVLPSLEPYGGLVTPSGSIDEIGGLGWATFFVLDDLPDSLSSGAVTSPTCGTTSKHCRSRAAVGLEPSLQRTSPQNGNIRVFSWRLSAIPVVGAGEVDAWRPNLMRETPLFPAFSRVL
jgi:hypothetical protein